MPFYENREYDRCPNVTPERWAEIQKKFPHLPELQDINAVRKETFLRLPKDMEDWIVKTFLHDPRDAIMVSLILNIVFSIVPLTLLLFYRPSHYLGLGIMVFKFFMFLQRFILMMHYSEHRRLWKNPYHTVGKHFLNFIVSPFFGIPPGMYRLHHVVMHHVENNICPEDLSTTEPFERGQLSSFIQYYLNYIKCLVLLPIWAYQHEHYDMCLKGAGGCAVWLSIMIYGLCNYYIATLWTLVIPFMIVGVVMMFGNYSQHIFVNPKIATMPQNKNSFEYNCALTVQLINHFDNQYTFNDGYHVTHHISSRCHWTEMPKHFLDNIEEFAANDVMCFDNMGFMDIGFCVHFGWWDTLYDNYVHFTKQKRPKEEVIAQLKSCLKPIAPRSADAKITKKTN